MPGRRSGRSDLLSLLFSAERAVCLVDDGFSCDARRMASWLGSGSSHMKLWRAMQIACQTIQVSIPLSLSLRPCLEQCAHSDSRLLFQGEDYRRNAIRGLLEASSLKNLSCSRCTLPNTLEHIFSHVRHTMHVEYGFVTQHVVDTCEEGLLVGGRVGRWMSEEEIKTIGITAGVKKASGRPLTFADHHLVVAK